MLMVGPVAAKDQSSRQYSVVFRLSRIFRSTPLLGESINYFGRHVWLKQSCCGHEEEEGLWTAAALGCVDSLHAHR
jgi:hypothetical protein